MQVNITYDNEGVLNVKSFNKVCNIVIIKEDPPETIAYEEDINMMTCPRCYGNRQIPDYSKPFTEEFGEPQGKTCTKCNGEGRIYKSQL